MVSLYNEQLTKMRKPIFVQSGQYTTERKEKNPGALISHISWVYLFHGMNTVQLFNSLFHSPPWANYNSVGIFIH